MKIIYVDDEKKAYQNFQYDIEHRADIKSMVYFQRPLMALEYAKDNPIDVAFLDVTMPEMNGIELAKELKKLDSSIEIIYVTGYEEYALEAFKVGGRAFLTKPYTEEELEEVFLLLDKLLDKKEKKENKAEVVEHQDAHVFMRTFGNFDMLVDGKPVIFKNSKAKELLALLVDRKGGSISSNQIFQKLWEEREYSQLTSTYVRRTVRALINQLESLELGDMVENNRNSLHINVNVFSCDYYEVMKGNTDYKCEYNGYYMTQYYWAEETIAIIENKIRSM